MGDADNHAGVASMKPEERRKLQRRCSWIDRLGQCRTIIMDTNKSGRCQHHQSGTRRINKAFVDQALSHIRKMAD